MKEYMIHTEHLSVGYRGVPLIRDIEIHVSKGEILSLIGPNGAGKSTILKSIIRQLALIGGTVYLDGRSMRDLPERTIAQSMSVLMTERVQPELMTCGDVVGTGRYPYTGRMGILSADDRRKVREAMALVHAEDLHDCDFSQISDGQRQRVLLARAICQEPEVIVLDEPTSFLDIRYKLELLSILKQLVREKQLAIVMSLHEIDLAQKVSDHILCVRHSAVDRYGTRRKFSLADILPSYMKLPPVPTTKPLVSRNYRQCRVIRRFLSLAVVAVAYQCTVVYSSRVSLLQPGFCMRTIWIIRLLPCLLQKLSPNMPMNLLRTIHGSLRVLSWIPAGMCSAHASRLAR